MPLHPPYRTRALVLAALLFASCGDDSDANPEDDDARDAGKRRDASVHADAADDDEDTDDRGEVVDARVRDAATDARAPRDAATDAHAPSSDARAAANDAAQPDPTSAEVGRLVGMTAAHNAVRAMVETKMSLPPMTWSSELAAYAQEWADHLATTACTMPAHRSGADLQAKRYGENLAYFASNGPGFKSTAESAVESWAGEVDCYGYGPFMLGDQCNVACYTAMHSDGCGHYTQIVWRKSTQVGCGMATCNAGGATRDIWICNYSPAGNFVGQAPY